LSGFSTRLRVRWAEVDAQAIVFNGHYLTYFDVGITEYWRAIGLPYPEGLADTGGDLFVVKSLINYHGSARYDDLLDIGVKLARIGNSSMIFEIAIHKDEELLITGEVVYVFADPHTRASKRVPAVIRDAVARFEKPH
jgi:YbgC/YbaW family acyl-CoA thioester hydrolase